MEKKLKEVKKLYINQEIPEELKIMVNKTIKDSKDRKTRSFRYKAASVAAVVAISGSFIVGLNTNEAFAKTIDEIPILKNIADVFTFKDYEMHSELINEDINIPAVVGLGDEKFEQKINDEIYEKMTAHISEAEQRAAEYKEAYIATGGTEEDYRPIDVVVDYKLYHADENYLSFAVYQTESLASAYFEIYYYNINLKTNETMTLESIFGKDYKNIINKQIADQIQERIQNQDCGYFKGDAGFKSIADNQNFYLNEDGKVVIIFDKYEIASGGTGRPEFVIEQVK